MGRFALALVALLVLPATAVGKGRTLAPPGNSGVSQYVESVPTAGGGQPSNSVHPITGAAGHSGSGRGGGPGSGAGGAIPTATQRALNQQGADGRSAAALAVATAPRSSGGQGGTTGGTESASSSSATPHATGSSPVSSVFKALTGSSSSGAGLGVLLPIILIVCALVLSVVAVVRRRQTT